MKRKKANEFLMTNVTVVNLKMKIQAGNLDESLIKGKSPVETETYNSQVTLYRALTCGVVKGGSGGWGTLPVYVPRSGVTPAIRKLNHI